MELEVKINDSVYQVKEWFLVKGLTLNLDNTYVIKFSSTKRKAEQIHFWYHNIIKETDGLKFLGFELGKILNWKIILVNFYLD
jgi:hypothetical protein